jgi:dienelactone hydrolase
VRIRTSIRALLGVIAAGLVLGATPALAAPLTCAPYGELRICSGQVASFDGATLDVDVTRPLRPQGARSHPLIVMLHGFGNDKHEWQSTNDDADGADKWHWSSHWFASRGYYVLTYTARGFRTDEADDPYEPKTPAGTSLSFPDGTIHLKSRAFEIRDTQWLAAVAARRFPGIDPRRVAVTGGSYGGGESWLQAARPHWTFPNRRTRGRLPALELQVAVPKYGWTDLAYSLAPNGRNVFRGPFGTPKQSYTGVFYAFGNQDGTFQPEVHAWNARIIGLGDPYDLAGVEDPVIAQARRGLTVERSAHYQRGAWRAQTSGREVAIFAIQGWTDDLFPAVESLRQFSFLKGLDPRWPVEVELADVGHPRALNKPGTWQRLNTRAFAFLRSHIGGSHRQSTGITSEESRCAGVGPSKPRLGSRVLALTFPAGALTSTSGAGDPDALETDPVAGFAAAGAHCRESRAASWPGRYTALSDPLAADTTYAGLGTVAVPYTLLGGTTATLHARLWDVSPAGTATFVDRGTYRLDLPVYDPASGSLELPLFGNEWTFGAGHRLRLDLVQVDEPFLRHSNVPSALSFGPPVLQLPVR